MVVGGLATDFCVKTTVLQLNQAGFDVIVNLAACRGVATESTTAACQEMLELGIKLISNSAELTN